MKAQYEQLEFKKIIRAIEPERRILLQTLDIFESLPSTNSYLLEQIKKNTAAQANGRVCLAETQTAGRGRQGKLWYSPPYTNIYCSLSWSFSDTFNDLAALSIVVAILIISALEKLDAPAEKLGIKWPNDLLSAGRKLAGILLENIKTPVDNKVVIGIGLNLCLPEEKNNAWIGLKEIVGKDIARNQAVGILLNELLVGMAHFETQGLTPFLSSYQQHDALKGKKVLIHTPTTSWSGIADGINQKGELRLLNEEHEVQYFSYGEVSVQY